MTVRRLHGVVLACGLVLAASWAVSATVQAQTADPPAAPSVEPQQTPAPAPDAPPAQSDLSASPQAPARDLDAAYGAYQRGLYLTAFREATRRIERDPNDAAAMTLIGELYANGFGLRQDWAKAADWYRLAAQRGDAQAAYAMAMLMIDGRGVTRDVAAGRQLLASAADKVPAAAYAMGVLLLEENKPESDRRAAALIRQAAEASQADAQYAMAVLYKQGRGVTRDPIEMLVWLTRAAANRSVAAQVDYAIMLFNGDGVPKNEGVAAKFFLRAAERGNPIAQNRVARLLAAGRGVPKNLVEAAKWHSLAKERGLADGWLDEELKALTPVERARADEAARRWSGE